MQNKTILYLVPNCHTLALRANTSKRKHVLEKLGFRVLLFKYQENNFLSYYFIFKLLQQSNLIIIRIDGSCHMDKFSLLKLLGKRLVVWEVHGFPEENNLPPNQWSPFKLLLKTLQRRLFSLLVDGCLFISPQLENYARQKIFIKHCKIIPNFVEPLPKNRQKLPALVSYRNFFKVVWVGDPSFPWQAIDLFESVAKRSAGFKQQIIFIVAGSHPWHKFHWGKNILFLPSLKKDDYYSLIKSANICLGLYHQPQNFPFYFSPLKILDYMICGKPIIASDYPAIKNFVAQKKTALLTNNKVEDIVKKIFYLKNHPLIANSMGQHAKNMAESSFNSQKALLQYREFFNLLTVKPK